jgi:hypothetical protein
MGIITKLNSRQTWHQILNKRQIQEIKLYGAQKIAPLIEAIDLFIEPYLHHSLAVGLCTRDVLEVLHETDINVVRYDSNQLIGWFVVDSDIIQ